MLPDLVTLAQDLTWPPALPGLCREWRAAYRDLVERRFRAFCDENEEAHLLHAFDLIPDHLRTGFLTSPRVASQFLARGERRKPSLAVLGSELVRRLEDMTGRTGPDSGAVETRLPVDGEGEQQDGIPLDFDSDYPFPSRGSGAGALSPVPLPRRAAVVSALGSALRALRQGGPVAWEFVGTLTLRLAVREEAAHAEEFTSGSFGDYPGLTLLTNPWASAIDTAYLVDALVHEAIHAALFLHEAVHEPLFPNPPGDLLLRSPWSGRPLTCDQYIQACFVWFGLSNLWRNWVAESQAVPAERTQQMYKRSHEGFLARPAEVLLTSPVAEQVSPSVRDALRLMDYSAISANG